VPEVHFVEQVPREALQASSASHAVVLGRSHELRGAWPRAQWTSSASNPQESRSAAGRPRCCCACSLQAPSGLRGEVWKGSSCCDASRAITTQAGNHFEQLEAQTANVWRLWWVVKEG
jgi:hypothetical protein